MASLILVMAGVAFAAESNSIGNNEDPAPCVCDLTSGSCDVYCCCDADCPAAVTSVWNTADPLTNTCVLDRLTDFDSQTCINSNEFYTENARRGMTAATQAINRLLCVTVDNSPSTGNYFTNVLTVSTDTVTNRVTDTVKYSDLLVETTQTTDQGYTTGDRISSQMGSRNMTYWSIPAPDSYGECSDMNVAEWLISGDLGACSRTANPTDICNSDLDVSLYTSQLSVRQQLISGNYIGITVTSVATADYANNVVTSTSATSSVPSTVISSSSCVNALLEAHYTVYTSSDYTSITSVAAQIVVGTVTSSTTTKIRQRFSIKFLSSSIATSTNSTAQTTVFRSGDPGYLNSYPLLAAQYSSNAFNVFDNGFAFGGADTSGNCVSSYEGQSLDALLLTYGDEIIYTCAMTFDYANLTSYCSGTLTQLPIFSLHSSLTHIGKFGKIVFNNPDDWVNITDVTSDNTMRMVGDTCTLPSLLYYNILVAPIGSLTNPQPKVVYVSRGFQKSNWVFRMKSESAIQRFLFSVVVSFIEYDQSFDFYAPPAPNPIPVMPDDVLYPFKINFALVTAFVFLYLVNI